MILALMALIADGSPASRAQETSSLTIQDTPDPVVVGGGLTYTITVSSTSAADFTVIDRLSPGVRYLTGSVSRRQQRVPPSDCVLRGASVYCFLAVPTNGVETVTIKVVPDRASRGVSSTVRGTPYNCDVDLGCPQAPAVRRATTRVISPLELTMDAPALTPAREKLVYRLTMTNCRGCAPVVQATLTDTLPPGVTYDSASSKRGTCTEAAGTVTCPLKNLYGGDSVDAQIAVVPTTVGSIENEATVSGDAKTKYGSIAVSDRASRISTVAGADLALELTGTPQTVRVNERVTYVLSVRNVGRVPATNVILVDSLPAHVTYESAEPSALCSRSNRTVTCKLGSVPNGQSRDIRLVVMPTAAEKNTTTITNKARVSTSTLDTDPSNDIAEAETTVLAAADLSVAGRGEPDPVDVDEKLTYTLDVRNAGPSDASDVTLVSRLSRGTASLARATQGSCGPAGQAVTCRLETIAAGAEATVTIEVTPTSAGPLTNLVEVRSTTFETRSSNNTRELETRVRSAATTPSVSIADAEVDEGGDAVFRVTLSEPATQRVQVAYETLDDTATKAGGDYTPASDTLVFEPGEIERAIEVSVAADSVHEGSEAFFVRLFKPDGVTIGDGRGRARIRADVPLTSLAISDAEVEEGGEAVFRVTLTEPGAQRVRVAYETLDDTATAGNDYTPASGTLVFEPGDTELTIEVTTSDDQRAEPDETFRVRLSSPTGAPVTATDLEARGTIDDNDALAPSISIADVEAEEGKPVIVTATLSAPVSREVRVGYRTIDGTARRGSDYEPVRGTVVFPAGDTQQAIEVTVVDDELAERSETIGVVLSGAVGATIGDRRGRVRIVDNDALAARFSVADVESKGGNSAVFLVTLSEPPSRAVRVDYVTVDGTATAANGDYVPVHGTLVFAPEQTERSISVTVARPVQGESDETFGFRLRDPVGAELGDAEGEAVIVFDGGLPAWIWIVVALGGVLLAGTSAIVWRWVRHPTVPPSVPVLTPYTPRYLNLAVTDEDRNLLDASRSLAPDRDYRVRIDIGELDVASLVVNPAKIDPGDAEPSAAGGHWLDVVLAGTDVDVSEEIHALYLPASGRSWVCDCTGPDHTCGEDERERYLHVPIRTREPTSDATVRCTVYQQNNALQSALLEFVVAEGQQRADAQRAVVDYALSRHFTRVGSLSPRLLNILTNDAPGGTHRVIVKDDSRAIRVDLTEAAVGQTLDAVRTRLKQLSVDQSGDAPRFDENNGKPADELVADLKQLASLGSMFWSAAVPNRDDRLYLRERLRRRATIQVSRVANVVFPWAVVYDIPREAIGDWTLCPLLDRWASAHRELETYPEACPYESKHDLNVLCPYGFWGFRHVIEQPPSVREGALKTAIRSVDGAQAVIARSLELDDGLSRRHLGELRKRLDGAFRVTECESRDAVRSAFADPALPLVYFYCHGKWGVYGDTSLRVPFLEIGHSDVIAPMDFAAWDASDGWNESHWSEVSPLVFINGCHTVELTPEGVVNFVDALAGIDAAGVVGTEIAVSQAVASEIAERFYEHFMATPSETVGTALLRVRIDLLRKGNVSGLIYTPFCSMDLALARDAS